MKTRVMGHTNPKKKIGEVSSSGVPHVCNCRVALVCPLTSGRGTSLCPARAISQLSILSQGSRLQINGIPVVCRH